MCIECRRDLIWPTTMMMIQHLFGFFFLNVNAIYLHYENCKFIAFENESIYKMNFQEH